MSRWIPIVFTLLSLSTTAPAAELTAYPQTLRPSPFGGVVEADRGGEAAPRRSLHLQTARAAHVSFHLAASVPEGGEYRLRIVAPAESGSVAVSLFREWFHLLKANKQYYPDALIPVRAPYASHMPEPGNAIPKQTTQAFWVDLWVPPNTPPGEHKFEAVLEAGATRSTLPIAITILPATIPAADAVALDHNTYGTSWFASQYPDLAKRLGDRFYQSNEFYGLLHAYHRIFYEHRGVYHQLGYGHAGKVGPEFAPRLTGTGRTKHIADWTEFDRHYGPLLDGTAFAGGERPAKPIPFVYLPVNPEWPASFLWWGEPGYEREFVNVLSEMERHFREKGWTSTRFELFFNHKKRYKGFPWDGDETRFVRDYAYFREYARMMKRAIPNDSPVKFVFRTDASWTIERSFRELAGVINFWVCGNGMLSWYPEAAREAKARGDIVWIYGGTPPVTQPAAAITLDVLTPWMRSLDGYVHWLATSPGDDPWFQFEGGGETLVYPGEKFGVEGPIPSVRLKLQRNAVEDITLLDSLHAPRDAVSRAFNGTTPADWWSKRPALADTNPEDWTNATIDDATQPGPAFRHSPNAAAWQHVHDYTLELAGAKQ
ncbi:MAG: hypothetical protein ABI972_23900 [Acidobacteriota bacterium]